MLRIVPLKSLVDLESTGLSHLGQLLLLHDLDIVEGHMPFTL